MADRSARRACAPALSVRARRHARVKRRRGREPALAYLVEADWSRTWAFGANPIPHPTSTTRQDDEEGDATIEPFAPHTDEYDVEEAQIEEVSESEALFDARVSIRDVNDTLDLEIEDEDAWITMTRDFYVCPVCGYTSEYAGVEDDAGTGCCL